MNRLERLPTLACCLFLLLTLGCSRGPEYTVDSVEIASVSRSFPDRDDWLRVVEGRLLVRFDGPTTRTLEEAQRDLGVALYVYTKGNPHPMYYFQYISGEPHMSRIAIPYVFEQSGEPGLYAAKWELTDIYFGDQEFNDGSYEAIAVAADGKVLERLIQFMSLKSLLNLPNKVDGRLVFSEPFAVEREIQESPLTDSLPSAD
jgi:hypothetical protein